jgi:hypothetical protein
MKIVVIIVYLLSVLSIKSCKNQEDNLIESALVKPDDYLVFGYIGLGRRCGAEVIYKIQDGKLYADTTKSFCKDQESYQFSGYQLPVSEYNKAKIFVNKFPVELTKESSKTFGCPGCADGGMFFIQFKMSGQEQKTWRIDDAVFRSDNDVLNQPFPAYLAKYGQAVANVFSEIKYQ